MLSSAVSLGVGVFIGGALEASAGRSVRSMEQRMDRLGKAVRQTGARVGRYEKEHRTLGRQLHLTGDATGRLTAKHDKLGRLIDSDTKARARQRDG